MWEIHYSHKKNENGKRIVKYKKKIEKNKNNKIKRNINRDNERKTSSQVDNALLHDKHLLKKTEEKTKKTKTEKTSLHKHNAEKTLQTHTRTYKKHFENKEIAINKPGSNDAATCGARSLLQPSLA